MTAKAHPGLLTLGGGYFVPVQEVTLIAPIEAAENIDQDRAVDATCRRKPRTAIFTRSSRVIISHLAPDEVAERCASAIQALDRQRRWRYSARR